MNENEITAVQHDGVRNYFGGRNLMPDSASPVMDTGEAGYLPVVGMARADVTFVTSREDAGLDG